LLGGVSRFERNTAASMSFGLEKWLWRTFGANQMARYPVPCQAAASA
jgi:hypothetical protein